LQPEYYKGGQRSEAWRLELDLQRQTVRRTQLLQRACEFAVVNPAVVGRPHSHFYALGANIDHPELWGPAQVLVKVSVNDHSHNSSATSQVCLPLHIETWASGERRRDAACAMRRRCFRIHREAVHSTELLC
jgi:carotenoid cleavage dioxygenase-like enzyme